MAEASNRAYHDLGGLELGPVDPNNIGEYQLWEKRVDAMLRLLASKTDLMTVDELRRGIETLGEDRYLAERYYGKWTHSIAAIMVEKGVISQAEIDAKVDEIRARRGLG